MAFIWTDSGKPRKSSVCVFIPNLELKPGIFQLHFENFSGRAKENLYMAVTNLPMRPFMNFIRQTIFTVTAEN
jgi:hypothetical protein